MLMVNIKIQTMIVNSGSRGQSGAKPRITIGNKLTPVKRKVNKGPCLQCPVKCRLTLTD